MHLLAHLLARLRRRPWLRQRLLLYIVVVVILVILVGQQAAASLKVHSSARVGVRAYIRIEIEVRCVRPPSTHKFLCLCVSLWQTKKGR